MADKDARSKEDEYFWRKDQEMIEKMRRAAAAQRANRELGVKAGIDDPELVRDLAELGFTFETAVFLRLMSIMQTAWADRSVSEAERQLIVNLARTRGIVEGSAADQQLSTWLLHAPAADVFSRSTRLIHAAISSSETHTAIGLTAEDLVRHCEEIAAASGGIFGMGKVSSEERALLS